MAIKTIELAKQIAEQRKALEKIDAVVLGFAKRESEIAEKIESASTDEERETVEAEVDIFNAEKKEKVAEQERLKEAIAELEAELKRMEEEEPSNATKTIERKIEMENLEIRNSKEYVEAFAKYVKTGKDEEVRSLLTENVSGGTVPVPAFVEDAVKHAWETDTIMKDVRKTYLKGNIKVAFEISRTGAIVHTEGSAAPSEENLVTGIITMIPQNYKKWLRVSDELLAMDNAEAFLRYIYAEMTHQIVKKMADELVTLIKTAPATSSATKAGQPAITKAVALDTIAAALGELSGEAVNPCIIMNRATWAAFKGVQYAGNYAIDVFEGLEVKFNDSLPAYASASANAVYCIVGDLGLGAMANLPEGDSVKFVVDEFSQAEADLVKIVGREFVGLGVVSPKAFCNIKKPE